MQAGVSHMDSQSENKLRQLWIKHKFPVRPISHIKQFTYTSQRKKSQQERDRACAA